MRNSNRGPAFLILFATLMAAAGDGVSIVAFPWLVLQREGSAGQASIVASATMLPLLFATLVAGTAVDYFGRRRVSMVADALSGAAVAGVPLVAWGPDVWTAFAGSLPTATAVLGRWPDIRLLAGAPTRHVDRRHRRAHPRCRRHPGPAEAIKTAATGWAAFWDGHLDLDALAVDVTEHLSDLTDDRCARW